MKKQIKYGVIVGLAATAGYDLSRLVIDSILNLSINPFHAWNIFGQLILGEVSNQYSFLVGLSYHLLNGVAFTMVYCLFLGGRNWKYGLIWAFGLEVAMLLVYPVWLNLGSVIAEFTLISIIGHSSYGLILGFASERFLRIN